MNTDERGQAVSDADRPGGANDMPRAAEQPVSVASVGRVAGDPADAKTMDARRNGAPIERVTAYKLAIALGALAWAQAILARCVHRLEAECARTGHGALCAALEPVMYADETAAPYREIAARLGLSKGAVAVAAHRIRARLRGILREEILQTVDHEEDFQDELYYLRSLFGK